MKVKFECLVAGQKAHSPLQKPYFTPDSLTYPNLQ